MKIKILKNYQMCVLEIIWETIEWNHTKENNYIIKDMIKWKILYRDLKKLFKYEHNQCFGNNENCFSETK